MATMAFDTRRMAQRFREGGFAEPQASILTDALVDVADAKRREVATKADLIPIRAEIEALRVAVEALRAASRNDLENAVRANKTDLENAVRANKTDLENAVRANKTDLENMVRANKTDLELLRTDLKARVAEQIAPLKTDIALLKGIGGLIAAMQVGILVKLFFG